VFFRLIEKPAMFGYCNPTSCHIADKKDHIEFDKCPDNRLYLSQEIHFMFDGYQTILTGMLKKKVPLFGIYFVRDEGEEIIEFNSVRYRRHKIIVAFETVQSGVAEGINFKDGSFVEGGIWHTYIHVYDPKKVKLYLTLKYNKTAKRWDDDEITYQHHEIVDVSDAAAVGIPLGELSLEDGQLEPRSP
jgi:hypothetical protein